MRFLSRSNLLLLLGLVVLSLAGCSSGPTGPNFDLAGKIIVAFGDSITEGFGDSNYPRGPSGYPYRLEHKLRTLYPDVIVLNRGAGGERTSSGVRRLNSVIARDKPHFVLILEGVNNITDRGTRYVTGTIQDLESMVLTVKAGGATPLIATLTPTTGPHKYQNNSIAALNPLIRDLADKEEIVCVDLYEAFMAEPDLGSLLIRDGLHPNDAGYQVMADTWFNSLLGKI